MWDPCLVLEVKMFYILESMRTNIDWYKVKDEEEPQAIWYQHETELGCPANFFLFPKLLPVGPGYKISEQCIMI